MGVHESNGSLARASGMIARLRKATTERTAHLREGYSERLRKQAGLAGPPSWDKYESVREETTGQANTAEPARAGRTPRVRCRVRERCGNGECDSRRPRYRSVDANGSGPAGRVHREVSENS